MFRRGLWMLLSLLVAAQVGAGRKRFVYSGGGNLRAAVPELPQRPGQKRRAVAGDGQGTVAGGDSGKVIAVGKPAESLLLDYITGDKPEMPKSGPPLAAAEVAAIRDWIAAGAKWPAATALADRSLADANWWSLQPLNRPQVPTIRTPQSTIRNPIDAFILAKLAEKGLSPSPKPIAAR